MKASAALTCLFICMFIIFSTCRQNSAITDYSELEILINEMSEHFVNDNYVKGISAGFIDIGGYRFENAYGNADARTLYKMASVTKIVTALAVMQLENADSISLNDAVVKHIPEFNVKKYPGSRDIRIVDLLTHSSGLSRDIMSRAQGHMPFGESELLDYFNQHIQVLPAGYRHAYSNPGFELLGKIIENAGGQKYSDYIRNHILLPLKMSKSSFYVEDSIKTFETAVYLPDSDKLYHEYPINYQAAGGLASTVSDMLNLTDMFLNDGRKDSREIFSRSVIEKMFTRQNSHVLLDTDIQMGAAFFLEDLPEPYSGKLVFHGGGAVFFNTMLMMAPDYGIGTIVFSNTAGTYGMIHQLAREIILKALHLKTGEKPVIPEPPAIKPAEWTKGRESNILGQYITSSSVIDLKEDSGEFAAVINDNKYPLEFFEDEYFSYREGMLLKVKQKDGASFLFLQNGGNLMPIGKKETLHVPVNAVWKNALGRYDLIDPCTESGMVFYDYIELAVENGILYARMMPEKIIRKIYGIQNPSQIIIDAVNDSTAVMKGFGRYPGEPLKMQGDELLFSGLRFRRK